MKCPTRFDKPPSCLRKAARLLRRTKPLAALAAPVAIYEAAVQRFQDRYDAWQGARHQAAIALGLRREAQIALDGQLRSLGMAIAVHNGRRDSDLFRMCFPDGYGPALGLHPRESLATAEGLLMAIQDETHPDIVVRREPMRGAMMRLEAAVTAQNDAVNALSQAKGLLHVEMQLWRDAHVDFYFAARQAFRDRRRHVEDLFRVSGRRKSAEDEQEEAGGPEETYADGPEDQLASVEPGPFAMRLEGPRTLAGDHETAQSGGQEAPVVTEESTRPAFG